jgi:hypothetical protein
MFFILAISVLLQDKWLLSKFELKSSKGEKVEVLWNA